MKAGRAAQNVSAVRGASGVLETLLGPGVCLLARHPAGLVALAKPAGVRSHPNQPGTDAQALLQLPYAADAEAYLWEGAPRWHLLHRLDAPTSGLILLAESEALAQAMREAFAARTVEKTYVALARGRLNPRDRLWRDRLKAQRRGASLRVSVNASGDLAETQVRSCGTSTGAPPVSALVLAPKTGRPHQLRVQAAHRHLPLLGDATYGDFRLNRSLARSHGLRRLCLHAAALTVPIPGAREPWSVDCPLPQDFLDAAAAFGLSFPATV